MKTYTPEEYQKKYGTEAYVNLLKVSAPQEQKTGGLSGTLGMVKNAFKSGVEQVKQGLTQGANAKNPAQLFEGSLKTGAGAVNAAFSPLAPVVEPTVGKAVNFAANNLGKNPLGGKNNQALVEDTKFQNFANSKAGQTTSRIAEDVGNLDTIAGAVAGSKAAMGIPKVAGALGESASGAFKTLGEEANSAISHAKNISKDVIPSTDRIVNHQVTQALDLTPSDLNNIARSTGNEVGKYLADNNLIRNNKAETMTAVNDFFKKNYEGVRSEIDKVQTIYKPFQVPRYVETLKAIQKKIDNIPGLQKTSIEVENLLNKKDIRLADVQRVKELLDEHFNLYKATGDVGEGAAKLGLDTIRKDIRGFIENQVQENTGADIRGMNNHVSTTKGIMDTVETRSPRGLTRSNFKLGDLAVTGYGFSLGGPLGGIAALFFKKLYDSPSVKLRFSKWLDSISDAQKAKMGETLQQGKLPSEFNQFIKKK